MTITLEPLCTLDITLGETISVGDGPAGTRLIGEVAAAEAHGRIRATLKGRASADWVTIHGTVGAVDVRLTLETDDGAVILVQYRGRLDLSNGFGGSPVYVAPTFETGDERYAWLNAVQAVGKGSFEGDRVRYDWFEVR